MSTMTVDKLIIKYNTSMFKAQFWKTYRERNSLNVNCMWSEK